MAAKVDDIEFGVPPNIERSDTDDSEGKVEIKTRLHDNGQLEYRQRYRDGMKDGPQEYFYPDGKPHEIFNYKNGVQDGIQELYHGNNQLFLRENYVNNKRDGLREVYFLDGQRLRENYINGEKHGVQDSYTVEGTLTETYYLEGQQVTKTQFISRLAKLGEIISAAMNLDEKALGAIIAGLSL